MSTVEYIAIALLMTIGMNITVTVLTVKVLRTDDSIASLQRSYSTVNDSVHSHSTTIDNRHEYHSYGVDNESFANR
jgi:hypothetical protein